MRLNWKKAFCAVLSALGILTGCAAPAAPGSAGSAGGEALSARGRFVETDILPPQLRDMKKDFECGGLFAQADGSLDFYVLVREPEDETQSMETWFGYTSSDGGDTWEQRDAAALNRLYQSGSGCVFLRGDLRMDADGSLYYLLHEGRRWDEKQTMYL